MDNIQLYMNQIDTMKKLLETGAITQMQYDYSSTHLRQKMLQNGISLPKTEE